MGFDSIPAELRQYTQWVVWREKDGVKRPYNPRTHQFASHNNPNTWATFDECVATANRYSGIGFVVTDSDPYAFIDLDDPAKYSAKDSSIDTQLERQAILNRQIEIFNSFDSYAEVSPSGKGLHIIVRGKVDAGRKRKQVEVYSSLRYMTMTGNVYRNAPIIDCNGSLTKLWNSLRPEVNAPGVHIGGKQAFSDDEVYEFALGAENGDKFKALFEGQWEDIYQTQSEADLALINIIGYYTSNKAQITRIFQRSALATRKKAKRAAYVQPMVDKALDRTPAPVNFDEMHNRHAAALAEAEVKAKLDLVQLPTEAPDTMEFVNPAYTVPPGLMGEIAQFFYKMAPRPVPEIALTAAIGLMAGICGRAYNVSAKGLNQYLLLLAETGTGKEAIGDGINRLCAAVAIKVPSVTEFFGPSHISSPQAITKYMSGGPKSIFSLIGEFGLFLDTILGPKATTHNMGLRRFFLDAYNKSGNKDSIRPMVYSDKEKNTGILQAPALTLISESNPHSFYKHVDEGLIAEGFVSRFTIIEYKGDRPLANDAHLNAHPSDELIEKVASLVVNAQKLNAQNIAQNVEFTKEAYDMLIDLRDYSDAQIRGSKEAKRQLWNRAHLKCLKMAALVAVGCNPYSPVIDANCAGWAIQLVKSEISALLARFDDDVIGQSLDNDENMQLGKIRYAIAEWLHLPWAKLQKYTLDRFAAALHDNQTVPYSFIHCRIHNCACFTRDRQGASSAIRRTLATLCDKDYLQVIPKHQLTAQFNTKQLAYAVSNPDYFKLG